MSKFRLDLEVRIQAVDDYGQPSYSGGAQGNLMIREDFNVTAGSFLEVAKILGQFHELAEVVKADPS